MSLLRQIIAILLVVSLANYGTLATAAVHSHEFVGFHQVHSVSDHDHEHDHHAEKDRLSSGVEFPAEDGAPEGTGHKESGLHTHSTPQFEPNDLVLAYGVGNEASNMTPTEPAGLRPLHNEHPPYKPPRLIL